MLTITFARHGNYTNRGNCSLNAEGEKESERLGLILKRKNFQQLTIVSSPADRAFGTAKIVSDLLEQQQVLKIPDLNLEYPINEEELDAETRAELLKKYTALFLTLPKETDNLLVVTHHPNIVGFSLVFAEAVGNKVYSVWNGGAVSYTIDAENWGDALSCIQAAKGVKIELAHHCKALQLD